MGTLILSPLSNYIMGMDSSRWEDVPETPAVPNFSLAYHNGLQFNYLKATQGNFVDRCFVRDWENCRKTPMRLGAYHFLEWYKNPRTQAEFFFKTIEKDPGELPPCCDFEWWSTIPANAFDILYNFLERMKQLWGKEQVIYTAYSFWLEYGKKDSYWSQYLLWLAHYDMTIPLGPKEIPYPWNEVYLWQRSGKGNGKFYGMESNDVDLDYMLKKYWDKYVTGDTQIPDPKPIEEEGDYQMKMRVLVPVLNIRFGPGTNYPVVGSKKLGEEVVVYNFQCNSGSWVQISPTENQWCCVKNATGEYLQKI